MPAHQKFYARQARVDVLFAHARKGALRPEVTVQTKLGPHTGIRRGAWYTLAETLTKSWRKWLQLSLVICTLLLLTLFHVVCKPSLAVSHIVSSCIGVAFALTWIKTKTRERFRDIPGYLEADKAWCQVVQASVRANVTVQLSSFQTWHLNWFHTQLTKKHFSKLNPLLVLFPNVKEITESVGMYRLLFQFCAQNVRENPHEKDLILVIGDGCTPRTAALFATLWPRCCGVHSIDPAMRQPFLTDRLTCHRQTVEEWLADKATTDLLTGCKWTRLILVAVHSHAKLNAYVGPLRQFTRTQQQQQQHRQTRFILATMPCCIPQTLDEQDCEELEMTLVHEERDWGVASEKRTLYLWSDVTL